MMIQMTLHEKLKEVMKPGVVYTWGEIRNGLMPISSTSYDYHLGSFVALGYIQECKPKDGINRSFRINQ